MTSESFADRFMDWLKAARDDTDREVRRQILLAVTADTLASSERDESKRLMKLAEDLYRRVK